MSNDLGRLIAAERNATAAINWSKEARDQLSEMNVRISKLEAENVQLKNHVSKLESLLMGFISARFNGGPTAS